jgi:hypothetical protein
VQDEFKAKLTKLDESTESVEAEVKKARHRRNGWSFLGTSRGLAGKIHPKASKNESGKMVSMFFFPEEIDDRRDDQHI